MYVYMFIDVFYHLCEQLNGQAPGPGHYHIEVGMVLLAL